jgi:hypothetical protein
MSPTIILRTGGERRDAFPYVAPAPLELREGPSPAERRATLAA